MTTAVFLGGLGRSGSTLVESVLAGTDEVCVLGEVVHLWKRGVRENERCECGNPFWGCPFWKEVGRVAFGGWADLDIDRVLELKDMVDRTRYLPAALASRSDSTRGAAMQEYGPYYARLYDAAAKVSGASCVIDSSKHSSTAFVLSRIGSIQLSVVHVVRDSRGVAYSWTKSVERPDAGENDQHKLMARMPPWRAALLWDAHNLAFGLLRRTGVPVRRLHYEELLADPAAKVDELARFLHLRADSSSLLLDDHSYLSAPGHQFSGNPSRFVTGPVVLRLDEAWRAQQPKTSRRTVTALTAPLLVGYGYLRPRGALAARRANAGRTGGR